ncbi:MAG: T9SS type A sorting domain-containing protein [Bacteroidetes bacterium]|nr:MAG: T9SS type A sorting domain-containing protein [Bacteroidota bacterium]
MSKLYFLIAIIIIITSNHLMSQPGYTKIPKPRTIADCIKQIGQKDKEGRQLYYNDKIYIKLKKDVKAFLKSPDELQGTSKYRFGISSIDEKLEKYGIITQKTYKQRSELLKKNKDFIQKNNLDLPDLSNIYTLEFGESKNIRNILTEFYNDRNIEYAEPVPIMYLLEMPNDTLYPRQQHLPQIKADSAWGVFKGEDSTKEIIIGISDTGVEWDHPDLMNNLKQNLGEDADHDGHVLEYRESDSTWVFDPGDTNHIDDDFNGFADDFIGWDFLADWATKSEGNDPWDYNSHGTHVSGIAAGCTNNDTGIASISWNVKFMVTSHSSPNYNYIYKGFDGIVYLADNGADVINCSWGGGGYSTSEAEAIAYATSLGAILVIAAGNDNSEEAFYPASYPNVISVASVGVDDRKANYSNYGIGVDISAPGGDYGNGGGILSTLLNHSYGSYQGTSMASPVAAGCMGLLRAYHPGWSIDSLEAQFLGTADNIDSMNVNYINKLGAGRVNPYYSLIMSNPSVPKKLRLQLYQVYTNDSISNNNGALEPGDSINIGFTVRNYAHLVSSNSVKFTVESLDPDVEVLQSSYTGGVGADGYTDIPLIFEVKISKSATSRFAKMRLKTSSDNEEIVYGSSMDFEIPITSGGILVWEGAPQRGYSGSFIRDFLKEQGVNVMYGNDFPTTLFGFDAVFLCFGSIGNTESGASFGLTGFDDWMADVIKNYLLKAGKVYIEGTEIFGWDQRNNKELLELFGVKSSDDGLDNVNLDTLEGNSSALTLNMEFIGSRSSGFRSVDTVVPGDNGTTAFYQPGYGTVAVQNIGWYNQKTFYSAYPLAELKDMAQPSTRYELVSRIMNFLGIPINYSVPDFTAQPLTGHAPLQVIFNDKSQTTKPIDSWNWEFGDGEASSSSDKNPTWTYNVPGTFDVIMNITRGSRIYDTTRRVYIFDGESALDFNNRDGYAEVQASTPVNLFNRLTIEAWIKPKSGGRGYFGRIADKSNFLFYIGGDRSIRFTFTNDSNKTSNVFTDRNKINFNVWNHVAVTYDGDSNVRFYVNGLQIVDTIYKTQNLPRGLIKDNSQIALRFGNNSDLSRPFDGSIDEARFWNIERTQKELIQNMNTNLIGNEPGLVGYWRFQEGNGATTKDETKNKGEASVYSDWRQGWHNSYIKSQPVHQTLCEGQDATFSVNALGGEKTLTYQWYKDNQQLNGDSRVVGVDTSVLVVNNIIKRDEGKYYVLITANPGNIQISSDTVELIAKNIVKLQRNDTLRIFRIEDGGEMQLSVDASGDEPILYRWYKNGLEIPGTNSSALTKKPFTKQDEGRYYCYVSNQCNNVVSDTFDVVLNTTSVEEFNTENILSVYPNPFNGITTFYLTLEKPQSVRLSIYDVLGNEVGTLENGIMEIGTHIINFDAVSKGLTSGIYYYSLRINGKQITGLLNYIR